MKTLTGAAAMAALGVVLTVGTPQHARAQSPAAQPAQPAAQPEKKVKDTGEYDIYNEVVKDINPASPNMQKAVTDLNTWAQKYPDSEFKDDRLLYYLQAHSGLKQFDKALDYGAQLMAKDLKTIFNPAQYLTILTATAMASTNIPNATPAQLAIGQKAATSLKAELAAGVRPPGQTDAQWAPGKKQLDDIADVTLQTIATYPGDQAAAKNDWVAAEQAYRTALQADQGSWNLAYKLGSAILRQADPAKYPQGLYFVARAAAMDPARGGIPDAAQRTTIDNFLKTAYVRFHGSDEGLAELKQQALSTAFPPADFKIKNTAEIALEKQKAFLEKYPEYSLWMGVKGLLTGPDGDKSFADMKDQQQVKGLKGVVKSGAPACRSKEIVVTISDPENASAPPDEITLKLDKPLTGSPVAGTEVKFDAVPTAFTKEPFALTMNADQADIQGMKTDTCVPAKTAPKKPAAGGAVKKAAPKK